MASGILRLFDFFNRGQMDRRLGPNWQQEEEDRQLKNKLLLEGSRRAEITSVLSTLDKLDEMKQKGLAHRVDMAGVEPTAGETTEDAYVRREGQRREEARTMALDKSSADLASVRANTRKAAGSFTVNAAEREALKSHGINLPEGAEIDDNVLTSLTGLRGHELSASAVAGRRRPRPMKLTVFDPQSRKNVIQLRDPETNELIDQYDAPLTATEQQSSGMVGSVASQVAKMESLAKDVGFSSWAAPVAGRASRAMAGVTQAGPEADFDYSAKLAKDLVYVKSGKQINETEQRQLEDIIPNRAKGNLPVQVQRFKEYIGLLFKKYNIQDELNAGAPGAPEAPGAPGITPEQARAELARRRAGGGRQ